jgi:hypothetical protein
MLEMMQNCNVGLFNTSLDFILCAFCAFLVSAIYISTIWAMDHGVDFPL